MSELSLANQVAIVTGASRGIGRAVALELARAGASVVSSYRHREAEAQEAIACIEALGGRAIAVQGDISSDAAAEDLVRRAVDEFGRIDILVCSAGVSRPALVGACSPEQWDQVVGVNLRGPFLCARAVMPQMLAQRAGCVIAVSSILARRGVAGMASYAASKAGLEAFIRTLAQEVGHRGVRVNGIAPGLIDTEMSRRLIADRGDDLRQHIALRRVGTPEEVAKVTRFLVSRDASYITGEILGVNGGLSS